MKSIVGMSDVGFGNALMLAKNHEVSVVDIDTKKVENLKKTIINQRTHQL